jgi:large-conductance mechanosensitive channel
MKLMKDYRLMGFVVLVLIALALTIYSSFIKPTGVVVTYVDPNTPCKDIMTVGSVITEIASLPVRNSDDFKTVTRGLEGITTVMINNNPRTCNIPKNSTLGITVENVKRGGLSLGLEMGGGESYFFKPGNVSQSVLQQTMSSIKSRIKQYELVNTRVETSDSVIKITAGPDEESYVKLLTEHGVLEGRLILKVGISENKSDFVFNDKAYNVVLNGNKSVVLNGSEYKVGDYFTLDGVKVKVDSISKNMTTFFVKIFDEGDLKLIRDASGVVSKRVVKQQSGYVFVFYVNLTKETSEYFAKATKGQEVTISSTGESFLRNSLVIFVDDQELINLPISGQDAGKEKTDLAIWGYRVRMEDAATFMIRLITLIETKRLPIKLNLLKTESYVPKTGEFYLSLLLYTILILSVVVSVLFLVRYRKRGVVVLPLILMCLSELLLIVGVISLKWFILLIFFFGVGFAMSKDEMKDWKSWLAVGLLMMMAIGIVMSKWVLGAYSVVGMIATLLIGFGEGVFMSHQFLKKREAYTLVEYKQALKKIWLFTVVASVVLFIVFFFTPYREFAMSTIIGLMISTTIVSPVYSSVIERIIK